MTKSAAKWVCYECGYTAPNYLGKCPECNTWGSIKEEIIYKNTNKVTNFKKNETKPSFILSTEVPLVNRTPTFNKEIDNVLGGGFVSGSLVLIAGEPGIGKSTILLQISCELAKSNKVLYISAEESLTQIKVRLTRLQLENIQKKENFLLLTTNNLQEILNTIDLEKPSFLIVDSIQAIHHPEIEGALGNISQVRECTNILLRNAKDNNITTILIGHVNKEGQIAGPKVLEHIVDTVLYFEGDKINNYRILRTTKNRFGPSGEIAVFEMKQNGLVVIDNPSYIFMSGNKENIPGSSYGTIVEGSKVIVCEIQALLGSTSFAVSRRVANGLDINRVLQIIAILERRVGFNFSKNDLFVNLASGLNSSEVALDLPTALAIVSCKQDVISPKRTVYIGEIGLTGEIRQVNQLENRIKECIKLGFERAVVPYGTEIDGNLFKKIEIIQVKKILEAIRATLIPKAVKT